METTKADWPPVGLPAWLLEQLRRRSQKDAARPYVPMEDHREDPLKRSWL